MSKFIDSFIKKNKPQFTKYNRYIKQNDWSTEIDVAYDEEKEVEELTQQQLQTKEILKILEDKVKLKRGFLKQKEDEFKVQDTLVIGILNRLKYFVKKTESDHHLKKFKQFIKYSLNIIDIHTNRVDSYINDVDISTIKNTDLKRAEIEFHNELFKAISKIQDVISELNISEDAEETTGIEFLGGVKAPLSMHKILVKLYPEIDRKLKAMKIDFDSPPDNKMHLYNDNAPVWNVDKHYFDQDSKTLQYYVDEFKKLENGISIDGVYFSGWAYYHMNVYITSIPHKVWNDIKKDYDSKDKEINPPLRDSDWMIFENRERQEKMKILFMFIAATRRAAKTTAESSMLAHAATIGKPELLCAGASAKDLGQVAKNFKTDILHKNPAFAVYNVTNDWDKKVEMGIKRKDGKTIPLSTLHIINTDSGNNKEIFAGFTPDVMVLDEAMKEKFLEALEGLLPALRGEDGMVRCFGLLSGTGGCLTKNNKVFDKTGNIVNIDKITKESGIIGYDGKGYSVENIPYIQAPTSKECLRIETVTGRFIECSTDHPILTRTETLKSYGGYKQEFVEAKDLKLKKHIAIIDSVDLWGEKDFEKAREIGWLIGDGSYGKGQGVKLNNCETEINEYMFKNYECNVYRSYKTKKGKDYKEYTIRNLTRYLREIGIQGQTKLDKRLPENIASYSKKSVCDLIGGIFDADGHVLLRKNKSRTDSFIPVVSVSQASVELLREVQLVLQKIGIHGYIRKREPRKNNPKDRNPWYELDIRDGKSLIKFYENIEFKVVEKQERLKSIFEYCSKKKLLLHDGVRYEKIKSIENIGIQPVYNLEAGVTHTYIGNGVITHNTDALSSDGLKCLTDPETYDILPMQWDILERGIPLEHITWEEDKLKPFGTFIPGQCRVDMPKIDSTLADYLGKTESEELRKIKIKVTNWELAKEQVDKRREKVSKDKIKLQKEIVYCPLKPSEIFMSGARNRFPVAEAKAHKAYLLETGLWDRRRNLYRDSTGKIQVEISNKELAEFPHRGGIVDAPFLIFEDPPKEKPKYGTYTGGFDDYASEESDTSSLSSFYVMKNEILGDPFSNKIVASITFRPGKHREVHEKWLMLMELYNLDQTAFGENFNYAIKEHLERTHVADKYLAPSLDFSASFNIPNSGRRKTGWNPTTSKKFLFNLFVDYCNEDFELEKEDGTIVMIKGVQRIDDIGLLEEIIQYSENLNVDRITSAMGCNGYRFYLISSHRWKPSAYRRDRGEDKPKTPKKRERSFYTPPKKRAGFYKSRR